jgi:hypothetical protein
MTIIYSSQFFYFIIFRIKFYEFLKNNKFKLKNHFKDFKYDFIGHSVKLKNTNTKCLTSINSLF